MNACLAVLREFFAKPISFIRLCFMKSMCGYIGCLDASFSGLGNCVHNNHEKESTWRWSTPRYNFVTIMWPTRPGVNAFSQYRKRNMQWVKLISLNLETSCCTYNVEVPWNEKHPGSMKKYKKVSQIVAHFSLSNQIKSYLTNMRVLAILSIALSATIGK